jgi:D-glycero-D-manno-heptose 1,7-bisphosphate phosphatase
MSRRAILFDRDGTLIVEKHYLHDPNEVVLEAGVVEALVRLRDLGFVFVVVSNQSVVGRGYFGLDAVDTVNARVAKILDEHGIVVEGWYVCPHAPDEPCDCRKPLPSLALRAAKELGLDLGRSWVVGDKKSDVAFADAVGARSILVATGHGGNDVAWAEANGKPVAADMKVAADIITERCAEEAPP